LRVLYTGPAAADVVAILDRLAAQSAQGARERLQDVEFLLAQFPNAGQLTRLPWLRLFAVLPYPYLVFYEAMSAEIIIHSVWHAARTPSDRPD